VSSNKITLFSFTAALTQRRSSRSSLGNNSPASSPGSDVDKSQGGMDLEFAKSLRDFFRDIRVVQTGFKDMKDYCKLHIG